MKGYTRYDGFFGSIDLLLAEKILPFALVSSQPVPTHPDVGDDHEEEVRQNDSSKFQDEQVISVRITSSVAVGRGKGKSNKISENEYGPNPNTTFSPPLIISQSPNATNSPVNEDIENQTENVANYMAGANIDFIKQLQARKEAKGVNGFEHVNPSDTMDQFNYTTEDFTTELYDKTVPDADATASETEENIENVPVGRSISSLSAKNYLQTLTHESLLERESNTRLTTVSFNIVHDNPKVPNNYEQSTNTFNQNQAYYNPPQKIQYSQPSQVYSEPAKFYSEPAKFYSEPAKIYSEPAKVYSEPAKIYSEPAKFYSQPASLHLTPQPLPNHTPWPLRSRTISDSTSTVESEVTTTQVTTVAHKTNTEAFVEHQPEKNYEVDEKVSVMTDGRSHGVQKPNNENCKQENCKVGYVVEGRQYKKYRVEERTSDGFIVGEYGVVRNEDGALRGVRYTADSEASPRLIQDALMKFLQLK